MSFKYPLAAVLATTATLTACEEKGAEERLDRQEEALDEAAEGIAETQAASEGQGELRQEVAGHEAELDEILEEHAAAMERAFQDGGV